MTDKYNVSLELAKRLSALAEAAWADGSMIEQVTPTTGELLRYWFCDEFCAMRKTNFHVGQRRAILNTIYLHEVVGSRSVLETYERVAPDLLAVADGETLRRDKYRMPKYAVKMATGTGKTWVMHALLIWQLLNARREEVATGRYTQHFLIVAPGLIVYDRLKDAFCGRMRAGEEWRDAETCDFRRFQELFLPPHLREEVFSFLQNNVVTKEEGIGRKTTGDGLIALTNWHLFENQIEEARPADDDALTPPEIVGELLPVRPGVSAGNDLGMLDRRYLRGTELEYLCGLDSLMVINDEAHHIHEVKRSGAVDEVEWQRGLDRIAEGVGEGFMQVDFSATPYDSVTSKKNKTKNYFPHIVADFDLPTAMRAGLVKMLLLDRRKDLTELGRLDWRAVRDEGERVIGLGDGQRLMLRAGLTKLRRLERDFLATDPTKHPKMLVVCEDTSVSPHVVAFLKEEGLADGDVMSIDSGKENEVGEAEWKRIKAQVFDLDRHASPKVIVSVMMLREGFDVNNICVLVSLRSTGSPILLEQLIGRGLRLMWREPEYAELKAQDRQRVLKLRQEPTTYIDMLSVIEHPAFVQFYDELFDSGIGTFDEGDIATDGSATGDIVNVGLKEGFEAYDFSWPVILREAEEELKATELRTDDMEPFTLFSLEKLRRTLGADGETFVAQESISKTQFGEYKVKADLFTATGYNSYLQKLLRVVTVRYVRVSQRATKPLRNLQINEAGIAASIDRYIRNRLFGRPFDPFHDSDWKILLAKDGIVTKHIVEQVARAIFRQEKEVTTSAAVVEHTPFSSVGQLRMRESCSLVLQKTIYERLPFPSSGGGFERRFMEFLDRDGGVERFLKINETQHAFAIIYYIRRDGLLATYHPDFIVGTADRIYLIETKGNNLMDSANVRLKQTAAAEWTRRINELPEPERMGRQWEYVLLSEDNFYSLSASGASLSDICARCQVSLSVATGDLFADC